jgi:antirestriction protein ArdC
VQPWAAGNATDRITRPLRHNGEPYAGMNVLLLWSQAMARGYLAPIWMTFKQASALGAHVRKGETSSTVIYASRFTKTETDARGDEVERDIPFLRAYSVFNVEQIEGLPAHCYHRPARVTDPVKRIESADRFFAHAGADRRHGGSQAYYSPSTDHIQMPPFETFRDAASYVAVLAHEHIHWTAKPDRVGRDLSRYAKDRTERAREELVAEIGAATGSCRLCRKLAEGAGQRQARHLPGRRPCPASGQLSPCAAAGGFRRSSGCVTFEDPALSGRRAFPIWLRGRRPRV